MRRLACFAAWTLLALPASGLAAAVIRSGARPETYVLRYSADRREFYLVRYDFAEETRIEIGDLRIDATRLNEARLPWHYSYRPTARENLIREGIVYDPAIGPRRGSVNTVSNFPPVRNVPAPSVRPPRPSPPPPPPRPSLWEKGWDWIVANPALVIAFLSIPALGWLIGRARTKVVEIRTSKAVEILYAGLPAGGKTALIARLRHPELSPEHFDSDETTRKVEIKKYEPIVKAGISFYPRAYDIPGSKPGSFIDQIREGKPWMGRRVLLIVLSPFAINPPIKSGADQEFVQKQAGYVFGLIGGVLTAKGIPKPDLVMAFLNKYDLFDGTRDEFHEVFKAETDHIALLCNNQRVKFMRVSGSARTGDGTKGVLASIIERIGT